MDSDKDKGKQEAKADAVLRKKEQKIRGRNMQDRQSTQLFNSFYHNSSYGSLEYDNTNKANEEHLSGIIESICKKRRYDKQLLLNKVLQNWSTLIGEENANACSPAFYDGNKRILFISIKDNMALFHFQRDKFLQDEILQTIKAQFPEIKNIRFQASQN